MDVTRIDDPRSDVELLAVIRDGDSGALAALYARHAPWLTARLGHRCGDADIVDQAVQDTFVAIWRKPGGYTSQGEPAAWIWGIGIRRLIDQLRRHPRTMLRSGTAQQQLSVEDEVLLGVEHGDLAGAVD